MHGPWMNKTRAICMDNLIILFTKHIVEEIRENKSGGYY